MLLQELEECLSLVDNYDKLNEFKDYLEEKQLNDSSENELIHQYKAIVSTIMTYLNISAADEQSKNGLYFDACLQYKNIKISTSNMSILMFFQYSYNYGVTLCQIIGKENEGLNYLNDSYNILLGGSLSQPILHFLKLKVLKAMLIANYSIGNSHANSIKYIDEYMTLCHSSEDQYYDMLCCKAVILYEIGEYSKTITVTSHAISLNPNRGDAYKLRGDAKVRLYMKKEAIVDYSINQNLNPGESFSPRHSSKLLNILNISSSFSLDAYEFFLLPTCQLPGHVAFDQQTSKVPIGGMTDESIEVYPMVNHSFHDIVSPISKSSLKMAQLGRHKIVIGDVNPTPKKPSSKPFIINSENVTSDGHNAIPKFFTASSNKPLRHISPISFVSKHSSLIIDVGVSNKNQVLDTSNSIEEKPLFEISKAKRHNPKN